MRCCFQIITRPPVWGSIKCVEPRPSVCPVPPICSTQESLIETGSIALLDKSNWEQIRSKGQRSRSLEAKM